MSNDSSFPWVVVGPTGVHWMGYAQCEGDAWASALGWPSGEEIESFKKMGWYAAQATVSWNKPENLSTQDT